MSTTTLIALLALEEGSCIGCRDGMEGEEAVDDDDEATREDREFCRECSPHDLLYPDIPEVIDRFGLFRDGMRGVTGSGSMYGGIIFAISISLKLDEPACLRIILVLPFWSSRGIETQYRPWRGERGGWMGSRRCKWEMQMGDASRPGSWMWTFLDVAVV